MQSKYMMRLLFLFLAFSLHLFATEGNIEGKIKVFIKSSDAIYTSQKVTVSVELLSNAFSITDAKITFPASKKYIVQAPSSAAYLGQEEVEDEKWQMVHYDYEVYALQAGKIEIPSVSVTFTSSMGYGQPKKEFALQSEKLTFDVKSPEGVKPNAFVLVTNNFALDTALKPEKKALIIGDAVSLGITQKAQGVPDILLTPIVYKSNAFLRVYEKEPSLQSGLKGKYDVSRTDSFTFVASGEGNVTLPAQEILWWNSTTKKVQVEKIPAFSFEINPDPQIAIDAKKAVQKELLLYIVGVMAVVAILFMLFASKIRHYLEERKRRVEESEKGKFDVLLNSLDNDNAQDIYRDFYHWIEVTSPTLSRLGFRGIGEVQPSFSVSLRELEAVLSVPEQTFDKIGFTRELKKFREMLLKDQKRAKQDFPDKINP